MYIFDANELVELIEEHTGTNIYEEFPDGFDLDDLDDLITSTADSLVPVYTADLVEAWMEEGMPEPESYDGLSSITDMIRYALYDHYVRELQEAAEECLDI